MSKGRLLQKGSHVGRGCQLVRGDSSLEDLKDLRRTMDVRGTIL